MKKNLFLFFLLAFTSVMVCAAPKSGTTAQQKQTVKKTSVSSKTKPAAQTKSTASNNTKPAAQAKSTANSNAKPAVQTKSTDTTTQKKAAEAEQKKLRQELTSLKTEITRTEKAKGKAADDLAQSEKAISTTEQSLSQLGKQKYAIENRLAQLSAEQDQLTATVTRQQDQLEKIMQQQYISGGENRAKLLFSGDNPNRISRELQYMNYFSSAYADLIDSLQANLEAIKSKQMQTDQNRQKLEKIVIETNRQKNILEKEKAQHATLLAQLSEKLDTQRKRAEKLEQDEKRLGELVSNLNRILEEQRKAAEKKAAEQRAAARNAGKQTKKSQTAQKDTVVQAPYLPPDNSSAFGKLRGKLKMPASGTITARYGMKRADGPSWKGIFIRTEPGAAVHAVANGRVVFADFLRGFGNLIIIDHGNQYMTIYGNTQSLSKRTGDNVSAGDTIAKTGNSGENMETGLYFEVRHNGRAYNPLDWIR